MKLRNDFTMENHSYYKKLDGLDRAKRNFDKQNTKLERRVLQLHKLNKDVATMEKLMPYAVSISSSKSIIDLLRNNYDTCITSIDLCKLDIQIWHNTLNDLVTDLNDLQAYFHTNPVADYRFSKQEIMDAMVNTKVDQDSIYIEADGDNQTLHFTYRNLMLTPLHNNYRAINDGEQVSVPLHDIEVTLTNSRDLRFYISAFDTRKDLPDYGFFGGNGVHPHIVSAHNACFGDFNSIVAESIDSMDFKQLAVMLQMFLESCDPEDVAGQSWFNAITKGINAERLTVGNGASYAFSRLNEAKTYYVHVTVKDGVLSSTLVPDDLMSQYKKFLRGDTDVNPLWSINDNTLAA